MSDQDVIARLQAELAATRAECDRLRTERPVAVDSTDTGLEQLRRSEERLRLMIEAVVDYAIILIDPSGKISSWNRGAERIKGYTEREILGMPYETFFLPMDVAAGKPRQLLARALAEGHVEDEGWRKRKDGTTFWADAVITALLDDNGQLVGYAKITRDLTEKKQADANFRQQTEQLRQSEERLRLLVEAVVDYAIILIDPSGKISSWNRGAERIKGYTEREILGMPYETFFLPEDVAAGKPRRLLARALAEGHVEDEGWRKRKDGTTFWADAVITALLDDNGQLVGYAKITRDLTERRQAEAVAIQNAQLVEANRLKSEFLANMSHELRTPLNSIIGYTDLVLTDPDQPLDELARGNLETVLRNGKHLLGLINDILDISKIEAGKMSVYAEPFELDGLLRSIVRTTEPLAREKDLRLSAETAPGLGPITQDETKVRQIVLNLLSNALKFTQRGQVSVTAEPLPGDRFAVRVQDSGVGIAAADQEVVFEEFRQLDASSTRAIGGTGLGLAISRKMARVLGGDLTVESRPGTGSTFTLELPCRYEASREAPIASPPVTPARHAPPRPADRQRVLLAIDDDPDALRLLAERLKGAYTVVPATGGASGLDLARALRPNLITLDVMMPRMDGWTVLRELKADPATADIPVVMLSFVDNKALGFSMGAAAFLGKPVDRELLLDVLGQIDTEVAAPASYVLVVDDDQEARELYRQTLKREGIRLVEAVDGEDALAVIEQQPPALVILDLMMPRMDGFELLARLRANDATRGVPVIVVSAKELGADERGRLASAQQIVRKGDPLDSVLLQEVQALLSGSPGAGTGP